jgi:Ca2+-binding RTX toxin-like protein
MPQYAGGPGDDVVTGGSGIDELYGFGGNDTLYGLDGHDYLEGGPGADLMYGGLGDDNYVVDNAGDQAVEQAGEGVDTIYSSITFALSSNVENLSLTGNGDINGTGNALSNDLSGTAGSNVLDGREGADTMAGSAGDDVYIVDSSADIVAEFAGEGNDTIFSSASFSLAGGGVETLILSGTAAINATGDDSANHLQGNAADNILSGRGGNDVLTGGPGQDIFLDKSYYLNGDTISDFARGDRIVFSDAIWAGFTYRLDGNILYFPGGSLSLSNLQNVSLSAGAAAEGGVQITFSSPPIVVSAGASVSIAKTASANIQSADFAEALGQRPVPYPDEVKAWHPSVDSFHVNGLNVPHLLLDDIFAFG